MLPRRLVKRRPTAIGWTVLVLILMSTTYMQTCRTVWLSSRYLVAKHRVYSHLTLAFWCHPTRNCQLEACCHQVPQTSIDDGSGKQALPDWLVKEPFLDRKLQLCRRTWKTNPFLACRYPRKGHLWRKPNINSRYLTSSSIHTHPLFSPCLAINACLHSYHPGSMHSRAFCGWQRHHQLGESKAGGLWKEL